MTSWDDLLPALLLGTDRRPHPDALAEAARLAASDRAGRAPRPAEPPPTAPPEARPTCPAAVATHVDAALSDNLGLRAWLLPEALELVLARGWIVTGELLPQLVDRARTRPELRPLVARAGGQRLAWLIAQGRPGAHVLRSAAVDDPVEAFRLGGPAVRSAALEQLRGDDPAAARELLASTWQEETPRDRAALLACLRVGLGPDDEPFLVHAASDGRKEVRQEATSLLARLPGSALGERMATLARACVAVGARAIRVTPPQGLTPGLAADGIEATLPGVEGARAALLAQVVARAPLSLWEPHDPERLLALPVLDGWGPPLHRGWRGAALAWGDQRWLEALGRAYADAELLAALPGDAAGRLAARHLGADLEVRSATSLLDAVPPPWPPELSDAAISYAARRELRVMERITGRIIVGAHASRLGEVTARLGHRLADRTSLLDLLSARVALHRVVAAAGPACGLHPGQPSATLRDVDRRQERS